MKKSTPLTEQDMDALQLVRPPQRAPKVIAPIPLPAPIVIAECVTQFLAECSQMDYCGSGSGTEEEIQEHGIVSPPEQLWYAAAIYCDLHHVANIEPQYPVGPYRVDFMLNVIGFFVNQEYMQYSDALLEHIDHLATKFVIEIDGFEWHDKTPEQAEHDKRRERAITQHGYRVLRYAAREVLRDPWACAREARAMCHKEIKKIMARTHITIT